MQNGSFYLTVNAASVHYSVLGGGEPLLICPVPWGVDGHRWTMLEELAKDFTLIRIDPRGTGKSDTVNRKDDYGIRALVNDIEAIRLQLNVKKWNVMGQSAGGWTALEYTLAHQAYMNKLVIVCSAPTGQFHKGTFRDPSHPLYTKYEKLSQEIRTLPHAERVKAFNRAIYQYDAQTDEARKAIDKIFEHAEFNPQRNQYFVMEELKRYNVTARLIEITAPTLVITGKHDVHVSPSWSEIMAKKIPGAQLLLMEQSGHFPWLDEPEKFFEKVRKFLL